MNLVTKNKNEIMNQRIKDNTKGELREVIKRELEIQGKVADLNHIDVSKITDMTQLFSGLDIHNIKIDKWDVSNVRKMSLMFAKCRNFNADLSKWNVSKVEYLVFTFNNCDNFNSDLSKWNVSNVLQSDYCFSNCPNMTSDKIPLSLLLGKEKASKYMNR